MYGAIPYYEYSLLIVVQSLAFHIYRNTGFHIVDKISQIELQDYGLNGVLKDVTMVRCPNKTTIIHS
jgi:hypothetical protein